jgi:hypothetical protein
MRQDAKRLKVPSIGPQVVNLRTAEDVGLSFEDRFSRPPMDRIKKLAEKVPHGNLAAPLIRCSSRAVNVHARGGNFGSPRGVGTAV